MWTKPNLFIQTYGFLLSNQRISSSNRQSLNRDNRIAHGSLLKWSWYKEITSSRRWILWRPIILTSFSLCCHGKLRNPRQLHREKWRWQWFNASLSSVSHSSPFSQHLTAAPTQHFVSIAKHQGTKTPNNTYFLIVAYFLTMPANRRLLHCENFLKMFVNSKSCLKING